MTAQNAAHQRAYRGRMRDRGFRLKQIWVHELSRLKGYEAALFGSITALDAPEGIDRQSWRFGYIQALQARENGGNS